MRESGVQMLEGSRKKEMGEGEGEGGCRSG